MNITSDSTATGLSRRWAYAQAAAVCAMIVSWYILKDGLAHFAWLFIIAGCVHTLGAMLVVMSVCFGPYLSNQVRSLSSLIGCMCQLYALGDRWVCLGCV